MQLKRFIDDDEAVSPVIGVILMVAITVILAAVIATFVLGLGEQISNTGPTASFDFDYDNGKLTITHTNGNTIDGENLYVRGADSDTGGSWASGTPTTYAEVSAGNSVVVDATAEDTVLVTWESSDGSQTKTLEEWPGSNA